MDESEISSYRECVIRVHFLAALLAFILPVFGSFPALANESLWTGSRAGSARAEALVGALRAAGDHGLNPAWYNLAEVEKSVAPGADPATAEALQQHFGVLDSRIAKVGRTAAHVGDRLSAADFLATMWALLGIDPHREMRDRFGRPVQLSNGRIIESLIA